MPDRTEMNKFFKVLKILLQMALTEPEKLKHYKKQIKKCIWVIREIHVKKLPFSPEDLREILEKLENLEDIISVKVKKAIEELIEDTPEIAKQLKELNRKYGISFRLGISAFFEQDSLSEILTETDKTWLKSIGIDPDKEIEHP